MNLPIRKPGGNIGMTVTNAARSHWRAHDVLARFLDRDEALARAKINGFFAVADPVIEDDPRVHDYYLTIVNEPRA